MSGGRTRDLGAAMRPFVAPGCTVALGDGVGMPATHDGHQSVGNALGELSREVGGFRLLLGWLPNEIDGLNPAEFTDVVALMPGWGVRRIVGQPKGRFVPTRLSAISALLSGALRPDVLVTRLVQRADGLHFATEVSWQRELLSTGVPVVALIDPNAPTADAGPAIDPDAVCIVGETGSGPYEIVEKQPDDVHEALADAVLKFIPPGARLQYGPGQLGTALLRHITTPVAIDTGLLTDAVVDLDDRGLLTGVPSATYLLGTQRLYEWCDGKPVLRGIEYTHDLTRLRNGDPLVAVNTALEIDRWGQINVEGVGDKVVGGIGGHPDFCASAAMNPKGLSIIAVPSRRRSGHLVTSPLVERLSRPTSTPAFDVDLIITEAGHADLRGADWDRRCALISELFNS